MKGHFFKKCLPLQPEFFIIKKFAKKYFYFIIMNYKHLIKETDEMLASQEALQHKLRERNKIILLRLLKKGLSLTEASKHLHVGYRQAQRYLKRYEEGGLFELLQHRYKVNARKLSPTQVIKLGNFVKHMSGEARLIDIKEYIQEEFEVDYTLGGVSALLSRHHINHMKP